MDAERFEFGRHRPAIRPIGQTLDRSDKPVEQSIRPIRSVRPALRESAAINSGQIGFGPGGENDARPRLVFFAGHCPSLLRAPDAIGQALDRRHAPLGDILAA